MEQTYGPIHPRIAFVLNQLGMLTSMQRKWSDAERYYTQAAAIYNRVYGPEHQDTAIARNNLASVYLKLGQYARAEKIFSEVIDILVRTHLGDSLNAGITRIKLGRALTRQGRYREAEVQLREGCAIVTKHSGPSAEWVLSVRPDLQIIQKALGQTTKAAY
jgi:tetratricopeptide (TPR) repeat protein